MNNEDLKVALDFCASDDCKKCDCCYYEERSTCQRDLAYDALEYIKELEAKLATSEFERKGLLLTVNNIVYCDECVHFNNECCDYVTYIDEHDRMRRAKDIRDGSDYCSYGERREEENEDTDRM